MEDHVCLYCFLIEPRTRGEAWPARMCPICNSDFTSDSEMEPLSDVIPRVDVVHLKKIADHWKNAKQIYPSFRREMVSRINNLIKIKEKHDSEKSPD